MADNTTLNPGAGGDTIRQVEKGGAKVQTILLDIGGLGAESLLTGTLPVSAVNLPLPTGASTEATLVALNAKVTAVDTGAVVVASSALPAGAATAAKQDTGNASLTSIDGKLTNPLPVSGTVTANLGTIAGVATEATLALVKAKTDNLDVALSTRALESGGNLATIVARTPALGAAVTANSSPVNIASDQVVPISATALPLPSGAATETTLAKLTLAQAADGTSTSGPMVQGVVNDSIENYTTGQVQPLSLTTAGRLRVSMVPANVYLEMFHGGNFMTDIMDMTDQRNPCQVDNHPWSL